MRRLLLIAITLLPAVLAFSARVHAQEAAPTRWGVVELSANFMREKPDFDEELGDQALMGTIVEILDIQGSWIKIKTPEPYTAWVSDLGLVPLDEAGLRDYLEAPKYICTAAHSHIYEEPSLKSGIVSEFIMGDIVRILYKTIHHTSGRYKGYDEGRAVLTRKFVGVVLPSGKTGYVPAKDVAVFYRWAKDKQELLGKPESVRENLVSCTRRFLGVPYMWGGTSIKNVDCSGLTRSVFFANGILLPRNASQQARCGEEIDFLDGAGNVSWSGLLPGDLVFWGREATDSAPEKVSHVGIYIGHGEFIHSSHYVRVGSLDPASGHYYDRKPLHVRRIVGPAGVSGTENGLGKGAEAIFQNPSYFPGY